MVLVSNGVGWNGVVLGGFNVLVTNVFGLSVVFSLAQ